MTLRASVVVPTCGRLELLERCLAALVTQCFDPARYEVVVVDDGSRDETRAVVDTWAERADVTVRYVATGGGLGPAAARNLGWRTARGEIIAFTDDDCVPKSDWLAAGVAVFHNGVSGASGDVVMPLPAAPTDYERNAAALEEAEFVTANCFYRRDVLAAVGGFDETFPLAWREDSDLYFRISKYVQRSEALVRVPEAVVVHPIRPAPWGISLRQQRKSAFNALLYKKHPRTYRAKIQEAPPWRYYRIVGALSIAFVAGLAGYRTLMFVALGAWLIMTARFCLDRLASTTRAPRHVAEMIVTSILIPPLSVFWRLYGAIKYRVFFL